MGQGNIKMCLGWVCISEAVGLDMCEGSKLCKDQPIKAGGDPPKNMKICVFHLADIIINEVVKDEFCVVPLT